jgi:hypothetical protein
MDTASVPGGYYSDRVAETAAAAGIRILFNSEPTTKVYDCYRMSGGWPLQHLPWNTARRLRRLGFTSFQRAFQAMALLEFQEDPKEKRRPALPGRSTMASAEGMNRQ